MIESTMRKLGENARRAARGLAVTDDKQRNKALQAAADALRKRRGEILAANAVDMSEGEERGLTTAMLDRLMLDEGRVEAMASGIETVAALPDPLGRILAEWERPNGLVIQRVSVPLGVIGIIYESRPNVTADAAALCLKSGNAAILRGGSESFHSSQAIYQCLREGLVDAGIDADAVQMVPTTDREAVGYLLSSMAEWVDVVVPRGGKSLIKRVQDEARVPVIGHLEGICHVYLHDEARRGHGPRCRSQCERCGAPVSAAPARRCSSTVARRTGCCRPWQARSVTPAARYAVTTRFVRFVPDVVPAKEDDWSTEYLDAIISIKVVERHQRRFTKHIAHYGSGHTESIITDDDSAAQQFFRDVDSAIVLQNASTQFADGGEFGMGAEIGIATGRIHARGPVGADQLTSYKYVVRGSGQTRP